MKPANLMTTLAAVLWGTTAIAQPVEFGDRFAAISAATWFWAAAILFGGILFRLALDLRQGKVNWTISYLLPTAATCVACGFFALGATEWYIGKGNHLHPFAQMGIIIAASVNHEIVLGRVKRLVAKLFDDKGATA